LNDLPTDTIRSKLLDRRTPEAETASISVWRETVTLRAVLLGLIMVCAVVGMTQTFNIRYNTADVAGAAPPSAPTTALLVYVLFILPLLSRFGKKVGLSRGEMLLIYAMMIVAGPIAHLYGVGYLLPHTVAPFYYLKQEPEWEVFMPVLPGWLGPDSPQAVEDFFHGHSPVPWYAWLWPILSWSSLLIALFWMMLCINVLMHRQWIENERLVFPLTAIPLALAQDEQTSFLRDPLRLIRQPLFWIGILFVLLIQSPNRIHRYIPSFPDLQTQGIVMVSADFLPAPWRGMGDIEFHLLPWLIGIVYLLPKEIALSCWVFYFVGLLENVSAVMYGMTGETPDVYSNDFPALYSQGAGAAFALTGIVLYVARGHLKRIFASLGRRAIRDPVLQSPELPLSYRTAFFGAIAGFGFILFWCHLAGMRWWVAALLFGLTLSYFFIFARIRAEAGLGMGVILWPKMMDEVMVTLVGAGNLTLSDLTVMESLRWLYFGPAIGSVMACQMEGLKLTDAGGLRGRRVGIALALAATITVPLAIAWTLQTFYSTGFESMHISRRATSMVGTQIHHAYMIIIEEHESPTGPQWGGIFAMGVGALVTVALSGLRTRLAWFPLHPIGFLAANSWGMQINWVSFFLGWLIKVFVTRYGGLKVYNRLLPFFLGLLVADALNNALWGLMAWLTRTER
jgi:hypothetical protein